MSKRSILASLRERERTLPHVLTDVMSKDVDCTADKVHRFQQKSDEVQTAEEEEEEDQDSNDQNVKLLAMEELVPISQSLITPSLARLFNLNLPPPQQPFVEGVMPAERSQYDAALTSKEELQLMQLQEGFHSSRAGEEDSRLSADDPCLQIMMDPFVDPDMNGATVGHKRSHLNAGLEGFNMQLGDGNNDLAESYGMHPLLERENSSNSAEGAGSGGGGNGCGGSARTLKRPRLVWTPQLHKRFVDAVSHLGIKNAVPKTIMQLMNVDGLTRENVASHLQKYRLYLRRVHQGNLFSSCANSSNRSMLGGLEHHHLIGAPLSPARSSDHLFSSSSTPSISMASNSHVHHHQPPGHINPLIPSHMQSLLVQQPQHQLNQAMSMIKSPPLHFNPHRFVPNTSDSPTQRSPWPSRQSSFSDINVLCHGSKGPPSPPRQALTLFPH